jgi:hypothetical protein
MIIYSAPILNRSFWQYCLVVSSIFLSCIGSIVYAQPQPPEELCDRSFLASSSPRLVYKAQLPASFDAPNFPSWATIETRVLQNGAVLFTSPEAYYTYTFPTSGAYTITQQITLSPTCVTGVSYAVMVYDRILTYLGAPLPDMEIMRPELAKQGIGVQEKNSTKDTWQALFLDAPYLLTDADMLLIHTPSLWNVFDAITVRLDQKIIYTTAPVSQSTFRRIASRYQNTLGITELSVIQPSHINILLSSLAFGKSVNEWDVVKTFAVTANEQARQSPVSYAIDYLLYTWFPLSMLTWMLLLPCLAVVLAGVRQIIGISVFGIANPLVVALSLHVAGRWPTLLMLLCGVVATLLVRVFTKKIFLLYSAKVALTITMYVLLLLFAFAFYAYSANIQPNTPTQREIFVSPSGLFLCLYLLLIARQVFSPKTSFSDTGWWIGLITFVCISAGVYWFVESVWIQNLLLGYPEITFIFVVLSIAIGRFSGLQLVEYLRFLPVIKYHMTKK